MVIKMIPFPLDDSTIPLAPADTHTLTTIHAQAIVKAQFRGLLKLLRGYGEKDISGVLFFYSQ